MKKTEVFIHTDYKEFLKAMLTESWGGISKAAQASQCQRSYLSRVMNGSIHLTPDQAFSLCSFWKMTFSETEYFMLLVDFARCGSPSYRDHLEGKLKRIRKENEDLSKRLKKTQLSGQVQEIFYYSSWHWSAIHILTSIPEFQTVQMIAEKLSLPEPIVLTTLETLKQYGLITQQGGRWIFSSAEIHVPNHSPMVSVHHSNWRQRAVLDSQTPSAEGVHYTVVQSMSRSAFEKIKVNILSFIDESRKIAGPSQEEELVCVTCDLFQI